MRTLSQYILILLLIPFAMDGSQPSAEALMKEGLKAIEKGDYQWAINVYDQLESRSAYSKALYVNRSLAHYKNSEMVLAIYYLEKARKLYPYDSGISRALSALRIEAGIDILEVPDFFLSVYWKKLSLSISPVSWFIIQLIAGILFLYMLYRWQLGRERHLKLRDFLRALALLCLFLFALALGYSSDAYYHDDAHALVMLPEVLYGAADARSEAIRDLVPGTHVQILDSLSDWHKVILENKEEGWVISKVLSGI